MGHDADLARELILLLEQLERSPPEPVFIAMDRLALEWRRSLAEIQEHIELLAHYGLIEGPGAYGENAFLFRKLTRKGHRFVRTVRDGRNWLEIKSRYSPG